jgi:hypothetical protein
VKDGVAESSLSAWKTRFLKCRYRDHHSVIHQDGKQFVSDMEFLNVV